MKRDVLAEIEEIRKGKIRPVYFLAGNDYFLQDYFIRELARALGQKGSLERFVWVPDAGDSDALIRELNGVPMFVQPRLFIVYQPTRIRQKNREELVQYCRSPGPDTVTVLVTDVLDSRKKLIRQLADEFGVVNTSPPFPEKMGDFVHFLLRKSGLHATYTILRTR
ncbi:MAG: DNA polymerase III subunit delta [Fidelibacterota bacterium]